MILKPDLTKLAVSSDDFAAIGAELLGGGSALRFTARGSSMHPLVRDGDTLLIRPRQPESISAGDIVLCETDAGRLLVHRVIRRRVEEDGVHFLIQGDQVADPDGWIPAMRVHGRLEEIERQGRCLDVTETSPRLLGFLLVLAQRMDQRNSKLAFLVSGLIRRLPVFWKYLR